jgi:fused signal recognition particle receptor
MPLPTVATYERVAAAADALVAELGREPTVDEVLARTGGSKSTVARELRNWQAARSRPPQLPDELRPQLLAVLEPVLPQLWALAQQHAAAQHAEVERAAQAQIAQLTQDLATADADLDATQKELADAQARLAAVEPELQRLITVAAEAQRQATAHQATSALLQQRLDDTQTRLDAQSEAAQQAQAELREQARREGQQAGELKALREQLAQQQALIERLTARSAETPSPAAPADQPTDKTPAPRSSPRGRKS